MAMKGFIGRLCALYAGAICTAAATAAFMIHLQKRVHRLKAFLIHETAMNFVFLDSGIGGVPYMMSLKQACGDARCVYVADTAHFPYGTKSSDEVADCASSAVSLILHKWKPDAVVIACNTISVAALKQLRLRFPNTPLVGTVPAIKLAAEVSKNHRIGLLATECTIRHLYTIKLEEKFASNCTVFSRGDGDLVRFIEHSFFTSSKAQRQQAVRPSVEYFLDNCCDVIILGCTHFTHIDKDITEAAGEGVKVVDSRNGVARQSLKIAAEHIKKHCFDIGDSLEGLPDISTSMFPDGFLFVTGLKSACDFEEYQTLCSCMHLFWGGILS